MKTARQLMKGIGYENTSVSYGKSRVILNHLNDPVVAYAKWFNGFLIIIKDDYKFLHAYTYACKRPLAKRWKDSVFETVGLNKAIEFLKQHTEGIIEKEFDEIDVQNQKKRFERPVLARFDRIETCEYAWEYSYRLVRKKDGMLRAEKGYNWKGDGVCSYSRSALKDFLEEIKEMKEQQQSKNPKYIYENVNLPKEIIREAEKSVAIDEL